MLHPYSSAPDVHMYGVRTEQRCFDWHMAAEHVALHWKRGIDEQLTELQHDVHEMFPHGVPAHPPRALPERQAYGSVGPQPTTAH